MKIAILGAGGQLGLSMQDVCPNDVELVSLRRGQADVIKKDGLLETLGRIRPEVVVNCAAYTAVDLAESEPELANSVNATGAENVAEVASGIGARLVHISTDFVFDGQADTPYPPNAVTNPLGVYGKSKLSGEEKVLEATHGDAIVVRTSWLYSQFAPNFVMTMLRLMRERDSLSVVADQRGRPTWTNSLANVLYRLTEQTNAGGIYHWADQGECSWFDFAVEIQAAAVDLNILDKEVPIQPITTSEYPVPAERPSYSVLDTSKTEDLIGYRPEPWNKNLRKMLKGSVSK